MGDDDAIETIMLLDNQNIETHLRKTWPDWEVSFSKRMAVLQMAEVVEIWAAKPEAALDGETPVFLLCALEYDFFGAGYTAWREISEEDASDLYRFHERDPKEGRDAWLCYFHKHIPRDKLRRRIEAARKWDCAALAAGQLPDDMPRKIKRIAGKDSE